MGEPQTPHFYDFGAFGRVSESQNQLVLKNDCRHFLFFLKYLDETEVKTNWFLRSWSHPQGLKLMEIQSFLGFGE